MRRSGERLIPMKGSLSGGAIAPSRPVAHGALGHPWNGCCDCVVQGKGLYRTPGGSPNDERRDRMDNPLLSPTPLCTIWQLVEPLACVGQRACTRSRRTEDGSCAGGHCRRK